MKKITTATDKQWAQIEELREQWIANQTRQYSHDEVKDVVDRMYASMGLASPIVLVTPSPLSMCVASAMLDKTGSQLYNQLDSQLSSQLDSQLSSQLYRQLHSQLSSQLYSQLGSQLYSQLYSQLSSQLRSQLYRQLHSQLESQVDENIKLQKPFIGIFYRCWSCFYAGAKILGVEFSDEQLELFTDWNEKASCWIACDNLCIVSQNPIIIHWQNRELHNESGMSVEYADGWGIYSINGVAVDEQIVMRPESQTIEQIRWEKNEEVKRIRIERYGWENFMRKVNAEAIDSRVNEVDGTHEGLFSLEGGMKTFVGKCRSTGRVYFLEVPSEVKTCEQAQTWFLGERTGNCIGAS